MLSIQVMKRRTVKTLINQSINQQFLLANIAIAKFGISPYRSTQTTVAATAGIPVLKYAEVVGPTYRPNECRRTFEANQLPY